MGWRTGNFSTSSDAFFNETRLRLVGFRREWEIEIELRLRQEEDEAEQDQGG